MCILLGVSMCRGVLIYRICRVCVVCVSQLSLALSLSLSLSLLCDVWPLVAGQAGWQWVNGEMQWLWLVGAWVAWVALQVRGKINTSKHE